MNRVLIYRSQLLPRSETFIRQQALALRDWRSVVMGERRVEGGLELAGLDVRLLHHSPESWPGRFNRRLHRLLWRPHSPTVRQLANAGGNLVHVHFGTDGVDLWPHVRELAVPMLVTLHGYDINIHQEWWEAGHGGIHRRTYPARLLQLARQPQVSFIAVSEAIRRRAIEYGIPGPKITVRYLGVDAQRFHPGGQQIAQRAKRVLFVGRLVEKKGVSYLIRAIAKVHRSVPGAELVIIGDGPLRTTLERLAVELGAPARFLGACSNEEVKQQMHLARVFCLPSVTVGNGDAEGLPIVILEAQAAGLPVLTSARGGVGEAVLDGKTGYAFAEHDVDHLGQLILDSMADDDALAELAHSARLHVEQHFDIVPCTERLERLFDDKTSPDAPKSAAA